MLIVNTILQLPSNVTIHHATIGSIIYIKINTTVPNVIIDLIACIVSKKVVVYALIRLWIFLKNVDTENEYIHILLNNKPVDVF